MSRPLTCRVCHEEIFWAYTSKGTAIALEPGIVSADTPGARITYRWHGRLNARTMATAAPEIADAHGIGIADAEDQIRYGVHEAHMCHFDTCPPLTTIDIQGPVGID